MYAKQHQQRQTTKQPKVPQLDRGTPLESSPRSSLHPPVPLSCSNTLSLPPLPSLPPSTAGAVAISKAEMDVPLLTNNRQHQTLQKPEKQSLACTQRKKRAG